MEKIENFVNSGKLEDHKEMDITASVNDDVGHLDELDGIDCPICKNKGYIIVDDDNGVTQSIIPCKCMHKRKVKRLSEESGLGPLLNHKVKNYAATEKWQQSIKDKAISYVRSNGNNWFCMLGQSGSGKTHICSAICNVFINQYEDVRFVAWNDFASFYKDNMKNNASRELMNEYKSVKVLYIDDLFKGQDTSYDVKNIAFDLINHRYNNRLKTIVSSEYSFNRLCALDEAIAGRIAEMCGEYLINIPRSQGNNYRLKK